MRGNALCLWFMSTWIRDSVCTVKRSSTIQCASTNYPSSFATRWKRSVGSRYRKRRRSPCVLIETFERAFRNYTRTDLTRRFISDTNWSRDVSVSPRRDFEPTARTKYVDSRTNRNRRTRGRSHFPVTIWWTRKLRCGSVTTTLQSLTIQGLL